MLDVFYQTGMSSQKGRMKDYFQEKEMLRRKVDYTGIKKELVMHPHPYVHLYEHMVMIDASSPHTEMYFDPLVTTPVPAAFISGSWLSLNTATICTESPIFVVGLTVYTLPSIQPAQPHTQSHYLHSHFILFPVSVP